MLKKILIILISLALTGYLITQVQAYELSPGIATAVTINSKNIHDGDLIKAGQNGYEITTTEYEPQLFGVVSLNPAVYFGDTSLQNATPIITIGKAFVRVITKNGEIKRGDFITSSNIAGVGMKATENGYVMGVSEEDYTEKDPNKIGQVLLILNPHFASLNSNISKNVFSAFRLGLSAAILTPLGALRYIVAAFIAIMSFYFGFRFFGRASRSGVEAIGRNPLASKIILASVALNVVITLIIMFFGVALAYLILVL